MNVMSRNKVLTNKNVFSLLKNLPVSRRRENTRLLWLWAASWGKVDVLKEYHGGCRLLRQDLVRMLKLNLSPDLR